MIRNIFNIYLQKQTFRLCVMKIELYYFFESGTVESTINNNRKTDLQLKRQMIPFDLLLKNHHTE